MGPGGSETIGSVSMEPSWGLECGAGGGRARLRQDFPR